MVKIALLADLHLSDVENTPQEEGFNWALEELKTISPDACVWLGDMTACGSPDAATRFRKKIDALPFPSLTVVGNSDIRTEATARTMERFLSNYPNGLKLDGVRIVGINTARDTISQAERDRLSHLDIQEDILLCSHHPPKSLDADSLAFLEQWIGEHQRHGHRPLAWVFGHIHVYQEGEIWGIPTYSLCALDLDKNCGDAHVCVMTFDERRVTFRQERLYTRGTLVSWSEAEKQEFSDLLGITCYNKSKVERDMPFAIEHQVRHLEWRTVNEGDLSLLEQWRRVGGQTFSLHYPSLKVDGSEILGVEKFRQYSSDAILAGANMVTIHPPTILNEQMLNGTLFDELANITADALAPVAEAGIDILVENNHTKAGTTKDPLMRDYGCTPMELLGWRDALRERLGKESCHLRFDVGHARNNSPISKEVPIGKWYALIGKESRSYHLHQTILDKTDKRMKNHHPITGLHDGLVSFDGFLWAWKSEILHHGPIILEIREGEGACATWSRLQQMLDAK